MRRSTPEEPREGVAATALITAAARALDTENGEGLLTDSLARALAGATGFELLEQGATPPMASNGSSLYVVRHRFLDDLLLQLTRDEGIRQVVLLAAGLDTRAFRLEWPPRTRVFEIDQPSVFAYKDAVLRDLDAAPRCERRTVPADLREDWPGALRGGGFDRDDPTAWVAEGLVMYMPEAAVVGLLATVYGLSAPGSCLAMDVMGATPGPPQEFRDFFARLGAPFVFTTDDPAALLRRRGWEAEVIGIDEVGRRLGVEIAAKGGLAIGRRTSSFERRTMRPA